MERGKLNLSLPCEDLLPFPHLLELGVSTEEMRKGARARGTGMAVRMGMGQGEELGHGCSQGMRELGTGSKCRESCGHGAKSGGQHG